MQCTISCNSSHTHTARLCALVATADAHMSLQAEQMLGRLLIVSPGLVLETPLMASLLAAVCQDGQDDEDLAEPAVPKAVARLHQACQLMQIFKLLATSCMEDNIGQKLTCRWWHAAMAQALMPSSATCLRQSTVIWCTYLDAREWS